MRERKIGKTQKHGKPMRTAFKRRQKECMIAIKNIKEKIFQADADRVLRTPCLPIEIVTKKAVQNTHVVVRETL